MAPELQKNGFFGQGIVKEGYSVFLEDILGDAYRSLNELSDDPEKKFQIKKNEEGVLEFYRNHPQRIVWPGDPNDRKLIMYKGNIYETSLGRNFFNSDKTICMDVYIMERVDINYSRMLAVNNLILSVEGDLSLGDRKIIRDIALNAFQSRLDFALNDKLGRGISWAGCVKTDLNETAIHELKSYGFDIAYEHKFREINAVTR